MIFGGWFSEPAPYSNQTAKLSNLGTAPNNTQKSSSARTTTVQSLHLHFTNKNVSAMTLFDSKFNV